MDTAQSGTQTYQDNRQVYVRSSVVASYANAPLQNAEAIIFIKYRDFIWEKSVLDIGCGAGRTAAALMRCSETYLGIDYSPEMVSACRSRYPEGDFREGDVRAMPELGAESFDFVLVAYNGLDYMDHGERLLALGEIRRVLRPAGLFVFSSHNRDYQHALKPIQKRIPRNPLRWAPAIAQGLTSLRNRRQKRGHQRFESNYALINDPAHDYLLLTYYISPEEQRRQLHAAGFDLLEMYDPHGTNTTPEVLGVSAPWIYFVARKVPE